MAHVKNTDDHSDKKPLGKAAADEAKFFVKLFSFLLLFITLGFGHYKIPSESMQPTLEVGDHIYVSKFTYGYSRHSLPWFLHKLPFLPDGQIFSRLPKRGDVVVFRNPNSKIVMIKRAVGLPGDEIVMSGGQVYLNGKIVERTLIEERIYVEDKSKRSIPEIITGRRKNHQQWGLTVKVDMYEQSWPDTDKSHLIYEREDNYSLDNTRPFIVPEGHVFMMGDNRDNSFDSRADPSRGSPGFVPQNHLIGRADMIMFSFKSCPPDTDTYCAPKRFFKGL